MPAEVKKRAAKWRVVEPSGRLVRNQSGTPVDGGGHDSLIAAQRQAGAINTPKKKSNVKKRKTKPKR